MQNLLRIFAYMWCLFVLTFVFCADFFAKEQRTQADYVSSFYIAGYIVNNNRINELYPANDAVSFSNASFDKICHQILPDFPINKTGIYMYSPLLAVLFSPLSYLSFFNALALWQTISQLSLFMVAWLTRKIINTPITTLSIFCLFHLFLPIAQTLWIGQLSIVFALLPLSLGCFCLEKNKPFLTGLIWSIVFLKPQLYPLVLILALIPVTSGKKEGFKSLTVLAGLATGTIILCLSSLFCLSPQIFGQWISSFKFSESLIGGANSSVLSPPFLTACLPGAIIYTLPDSLRANCKWMVYALCSIFALANLYLGHIIYKSNLPDKEKWQLCLWVSAISAPLYIPRLLIYDFVPFVLPAYLILNNDSLFFKQNKLKIIVLIFWLIASLQIMAVVLNSSLANPIVIAIVILLLCIYTYRDVRKSLSAS